MAILKDRRHIEAISFFKDLEKRFEIFCLPYPDDFRGFLMMSSCVFFTVEENTEFSRILNSEKGLGGGLAWPVILSEGKVDNDFVDKCAIPSIRRIVKFLESVEDSKSLN